VKLGIIMLTALVLVAIFGPFLSGYAYDGINLALKNQPPGTLFLLGSDDLGRDVFTRTCIGLRISLFIGSLAALIDLCIGVTVGAIASQSSERVETAFLRFADGLFAMPHVLLVMFFLLVLGPGILSMVISLVCIGWIPLARIALNRFKQIRVSDYVVYAESIGASKWWILRKHLLPNSMRTIAIAMSMTVPAAIFMESFLSFLGLGVRAPMASLGTMLSEGVSAIEHYPWRVFSPLTAIALVILSFNLIADEHA